MSSKVGALALLALSAFAGMANAAPVTVQGGTVHFKGEVVASGCALAADSVDQTVTLGQVKSSHFTAADVLGNAKQNFKIDFTDCDTTVASNASLKFTGSVVATPAGKNVLENESRGGDAATGVGIQLFDVDGSALDTNVQSANTALMDGNNTLTFAADYISTSTTVTPGDVTATATFDITYS